MTLNIRRRFKMKQYKKLSHAVWECKYHIVWCPKYRFRIMKGKLAESVRSIIRQLCEWKNIEIIAGNVQADHVHMVISFPPKHSISEVVGFLKGKSAIRLHQEFSRAKSSGKHFWIRGYFVSTVGRNGHLIGVGI